MCSSTMTQRRSRLTALLLLSAHILHASALPAMSSYEFTAYRMQQYNLQQRKYGCHGAIIVAEARSTEDSSLSRRCVIMKLSDFTVEGFLEAKRQNAAAVLILLPQNISTVHVDVIQSFMVTESMALKTETAMPVYVVPEDEQLLYMYAEVKLAAASKSASILIRVLRSMITATAFQIVVNNNSPIKPISDSSIITLEGVLPGIGEEPSTILITAHYDSFGLAPWLAYGADSNGSGITILLELARLFHRLHRDPRTKAPYHLLFSLTGGGKLNFMGTKYWIDENLDHAESSLLHDNMAFVLCLDSLGSGDELFLHVSRPSKPGTPQYGFSQQLEEVISSRFPWVRFETVHKKINLQESTVAWEHEHFGMRHIPAFTLSHLEDPRSERRGSILDTISQVDIRKLKRNTIIVAESLARFMYNLSDKGSPKEIQVFRGSLDILDSRLSALMTMLMTVPRATQLMDKEPEHTLLLNSLEQEFRHDLQQVYRHTFRQDSRDPELTFFDQMKQPMMMYRVKPAAFDLFLGGCIAGYLGVLYFAVQDFLLPRKPQTGYGCRPMFPKIGPSSTIPLFPPLTHATIQCPERKRSQSQSELNPIPKPKPERSAVAMPPAGCLSKPQPTDNTKAQGTTRNLQGKYLCRPVDSVGTQLKQQNSTLRPSISQLKYYRPNLQSLPISSSGYSCFQVVKPTKPGYYIIHPEFVSEIQH